MIWTTTPWTLPGNRAISFLAQDQLWPLRGHRCARDNWAKFGDLLHLAEKLADEVFKQARVTELRQGRPISLPRCLGALVCASSAQRSRGGYDFSGAAARRRACHRRHRHRLRAHRARPRPRGLRYLDRQRRELEARGINTTIPYTVDARRPLHRPGAGLRPARYPASRSASSPTRAKRAMPTRP